MKTFYSDIIRIDADQNFLSSDNYVSSVITVAAMASPYELTQSWIQGWVIPYCDGKCDSWTFESDYDGSYGAPYVLTAGDAWRHADIWSELMEEMHQLDSANWVTDMYSAIIVARHLGLE